MPEGPSIIILKEAVQPFNKKKIVAVSGNTTKIDKDRIVNKKVLDFKSWGKQFLVCFDGYFLRVHFLLFGTYRINEKKETPARLGLQFKNGELNFYAASIRLIEADVNEMYDWSGDVMNEAWDAAKARKKLKSHPNMLVVDALLNQDIFAGVGNIIKNEVLFRIRVHPKTKIGNLPPAKLTAMIREARKYSFEFLVWKKEFVLKKHWLVHTKTSCPNCGRPLLKEYLGKTNRRTFFCDHCQVKY